MNMMKTPTLTLTLLEEMIVEILLRLPVRSLLRFKCVCKSWLSLISDPKFAKSHFDLAAAPTHRLLLPTKSVIESLDLDASLQDDSAVVRLNLQVPHRASLEAIWGSCRGFILYTDCSGIYVWNPFTVTRRKIPFSRLQIPQLFNNLIGKGFGYDESSDDYLIVHLELDLHNSVGNYWLPRIEVFSLKTCTSYSICSASEVAYQCLSSELVIGLFLNHSLHWLVKSKANELPLILAFNLVDRSLSEILLLPPHDEAVEIAATYLNLIGGCLSLCMSGGVQNPNMCVVWVMKEYEVQASWTKSFVLPLDNCPYNGFVPLCFSKGVHLLGSSLCGRIIKFNDKGELIECRAYNYSAINGKNRNLMHYSTYRESLLSLPGDK